MFSNRSLRQDHLVTEFHKVIFVDHLVYNVLQKKGAIGINLFAICRKFYTYCSSDRIFQIFGYPISLIHLLVVGLLTVFFGHSFFFRNKALKVESLILYVLEYR